MQRVQAPRPCLAHRCLVGSGCFVAVVGVLLGLVWTAVHQLPGFGPLAADIARSCLGDSAVTSLEDTVYQASDRFKRWSHAGEPPRAYWQVPEARVSATGRPPNARMAPTEADRPPQASVEFRLQDVGAVHASQAAVGDGVWLPADPSPSNADALCYKTLLHPDASRSYAELFVVALDLSRVELHAQAGTLEPESSLAFANSPVRAAIVPEQHRSLLLAAFNGGFKSRHGHFGMRVDGVTLANPKPKSCTVASYEDGSLRIGTYERLPAPDQMTWFRQTPRCMVEEGRRHPRLANSTSWGATLDGKTVIRRSAIGLDRTGKILLVGISNSTSAEALAQGMQHAGAHTLAQLDVNYSFPRFLFYARGEGGLDTLPLAKGFVYSPGQYVEHRSTRDFFYVTRKAIDAPLPASVPTG